MKVKSKTIQVLQIELGKKFDAREDKLAFLSGFCDKELKSSKELTQVEASDVLHTLKTGEPPNKVCWAFFDKENRQHRHVISLAHQLSWQVNLNGRTIVDLDRLGGYIKYKSGIKKPLSEMRSNEVTRLINQLNEIIKKRYR